MELKQEQKPELDKVKIKPYSESHIVLASDKPCRDRCQVRPCLSVCPGEVYVWDDQKEIVEVRYQRCFECGACMIVCPNILFSYPPGGFGVLYDL